MADAITAVDCFVLKLREREPYLGSMPGSGGGDGYAVRSRGGGGGRAEAAGWRSIYSPRFETLLVRLTAEDGTIGWGEALAPVAPEVPAQIVRRLFAPVLLSAGNGTVPAPRRVRPLVAALRDLMRERGHLGGHQADALAAVDIALWDLAGRAAGLPVHALLGGAFHDRIPTYVSGLPRHTDAERAALAAQWAQRGVERIKLHLGYGPEADLATLEAVRAAAPAVWYAVDAHWAYRLADALRLADAAGPLLFLEAPLAPEDRDGHAELARRITVPVAAGEAMRHRYEAADWLAARALGLIQPDVARTGITEAMAIADLAAAHHVPVAPHHSTGLGVALAAGLQVCAAIEDLSLFEYQPASTEAGQQILARSLPGGPDGFAVPDGPGLGIEVDPAAVTDLAEEAA